MRVFLVKPNWFVHTRKAPKLANRAISRVEPVLESNLEALEHFFFDAFDISELAPTESHHSF
jgi:hypothetical protein